VIDEIAIQSASAEDGKQGGLADLVWQAAGKRSTFSRDTRGRPASSTHRNGGDYAHDRFAKPNQI
jgi:hypothetical protein